MENIYYKAFDANLCDIDRIQYEIGKEIVVCNPYRPSYHIAWARCAETVTGALFYAHELMKFSAIEQVPRIFEVRITGENAEHHVYYGNRCWHYRRTNRLILVKELSQDEIMQRLWAEQDEKHPYITPFIIMHAPFAELLKWRDYLNEDLDEALCVLLLPHLTDEEKMQITPKFSKYMHMYNEQDNCWHLSRYKSL